MSVYTHAGGIIWQANVTLAKGQTLTEMAIVDGKGAGAVVAAAIPVTPALVGPLTAKAINGSFDALDTLNPAVATDEIDLAGHMCMGHIYGVATTSAGELTAPFAYDPRDKGDTCEEAVAHYSGAPPAPTEKDEHAGHGASVPTPAPVPPASGAAAAGLAVAAAATAVAALL